MPRIRMFCNYGNNFFYFRARLKSDYNILISCLHDIYIVFQG